MSPGASRFAVATSEARLSADASVGHRPTTFSPRSVSDLLSGVDACTEIGSSATSP
ncbi:hypothetical protein [Streptomyces malaysiensis]|uniref:hypothetical protein n=1 Tax=Streptomyces malaysiensis TaxID=92644 RepID=UPI002B30645A|nr:hypothetical protein R8789_43590 [Streptomyces malaysiensis]